MKQFNPISKKTKFLFFFLGWFCFIHFFTPIPLISAVQPQEYFFGSSECESTDKTINFQGSWEYGTFIKEPFERNPIQMTDLTLNINSESYLKINIDYYRYLSDELHLQQTIIINQLIEFNDTNQNGYFDSLDTILQEIPLDEWNNFSFARFPPKIGNITIFTNRKSYEWSTTTTDGIFTFTGNYTLESDNTYYNNIIKSFQFKFDFEINNFPYSMPNSLVALDLLFSSNETLIENEITEEEQYQFATNESSIQSNLNNSNIFFSWSNNAIVDGIEESIIHSPLESMENDYRLLLNYPHGVHIFHDPKLGMMKLPSYFYFSTEPSQSYIGLIITLSIIGLFGLLMTKKEYREYLLERVLHINTLPHRLNMKDVLENEIRIKILNLIIDHPGIHYKDLLRQIQSSPSTLAWHLEILVEYKVIHRQRAGNYIIFYPYLDTNPFIEMDISIMKSRNTLEIYRIIGDEPGIEQKKIVKRIGLNRATTAYHLSKLLKVKLIQIKKVGRKSLYYSNIQSKLEENFDYIDSPNESSYLKEKNEDNL